MVSKDYAEWHEPVGSVVTARASARFELTDEQIARYHEDGYLIGPRVLDDDQLTVLRAEVDEILSDGHEGQEHWYEYNSGSATRMVHAIGAWRVRPNLHDLLWHPGITTPLRQLVGGAVRLMFDQLFCKPPRQGGSVSWHQDYSYWTYTQPLAHATCWIALDPADVSNGCLHFVPGSHKWGLLPRPDQLTNEGESSVYTTLTEEQRAAFTPVPAELEPGQISFHHPLLMHGSPPNTSDRPRRGFAVHVMRDGTVGVDDLTPVGGVPGWLVGGAGEMYPLTDEPAGEVLGGRYFPLL